MSEIGIVGHIYEDRRTKKKGKLIERDEKYKTLLLETSDGKSFNVSYGGFKSNWRSVDEHVETVEEAMEEIEIPEQPKKEKVEKPVKKRKERELNPGFESAILKMMDYAKTFNNPDIIIDVDAKKHKILFKINSTKHKLFNVNYQVRKDRFQIAVNDVFLKRIKDNDYVKSIKYHETWVNTRYEFMLDVDKLDMFLDDARQYVIDFMSDNLEEE